MSSSNADCVSNLKIFISVKDADTDTHKEARCSVPVHYASINPENCRSLAIFMAKKKLGEPAQSIMVTPGDPSAGSVKVDTAFSFMMQPPGDIATDAEEKRSGDTFQFSDDEEDADAPETTPTSGSPAKRDRLEIASAASDMCLEPIPVNFGEMPEPLQHEFHELHTIPVVAKSQEARISTIEDENRTKRKKWGDLEPDAPKNARFTYDIDWDVFMPNLFVLRQTKMLMVGAVGFSVMFKPVLSANKKSLSHTERIFDDIAKNTNIPRDHIFLKIPFPGAKKKDGCRAIPFGFIPLVLHYLRPATLRDCIVLKQTRSLLLRCYREVALYFRGDMPPIVKRQLRQFAFNMDTSLLGRIGTPLSLLQIRTGDVDTDVTGDGVSIESVSESESEPEPESELEPLPVSIPVSVPVPTPWPIIQDHEFSDERDEEEEEEDMDEYASLDGFMVDRDEESVHATHTNSVSIAEEEEEADDEADFMDVDPPRQRSLLRDQLLEMRYNHHTDDELDTLISHHLDVIGELNEVRRMRRVATRSLREKMQSRKASSYRKPARAPISAPPPPSRKRKRPSVPVKEEDETPTPKITDVQPPSKRVAVGTATTAATPKKKLRVYRMQSTQLLSSLPEVIEWTSKLLEYVMQFRPQFRQISGGEKDVEVDESGSSESVDLSFVEEHESESLGVIDSNDDSSI